MVLSHYSTRLFNDSCFESRFVFLTGFSVLNRGLNPFNPSTVLNRLGETGKIFPKPIIFKKHVLQENNSLNNTGKNCFPTIIEEFSENCLH